MARTEVTPIFVYQNNENIRCQETDFPLPAYRTLYSTQKIKPKKRSLLGGCTGGSAPMEVLLYFNSVMWVCRNAINHPSN